MKVLILGATGLVGQSTLVQAVTHPAITQVIALQLGRHCHLAASWQIQSPSGWNSSCRKFSLGESTR